MLKGVFFAERSISAQFAGGEKVIYRRLDYEFFIKGDEMRINSSRHRILELIITIILLTGCMNSPEPTSNPPIAEIHVVTIL